jgi:hypothetical protein
MVLGPQTAAHAGTSADSAEVRAAVETSGMDLAAHATNASAGETTEMHVVGASVDSADMRSCTDAAGVAYFCHPTEMRATAKSSHVAATTTAATRLGCSREQTRRKQRRGQNRCQSHRHDTSSPCMRRDPGVAAQPVTMEK